MSNKEINHIAEQYLKEQAKIIGKYGDPPRLHGDKYREALAETKKAFTVISASRRSTDTQKA